MKNFEKYKTAGERADAFTIYCRAHPGCQGCEVHKNRDIDKCAFAWLDLEAKEEKPLPCPFCDSDVEPILRNGTEVGFAYLVSCKTCSYESKAYRNRDEAIAEHNRVAKCIIEEKK